MNRFVCKVCDSRYSTLKMADQCAKLPVPRRRFKDGTHVRFCLFGSCQDFAGQSVLENRFSVMKDEIGRTLMPGKKSHRWQIRVRWLKNGQTMYFYEDELDYADLEEERRKFKNEISQISRFKMPENDGDI